ncbi:MarR family transcriptional regulator [Nonomuraea thailandensis]
MPGGRLTHDERQVIAQGLADGHTYTEIARRLQRPVSTVTREVIRNGGAGDYRADRAHDATATRARRGKTLQPRPAPAADEHGRDPETMKALEERFTAMMVDTGLTHTPARVLACLYITDSGSLTAAELVQRLQVSPASISKAVGQLEQQRLIRRERDPGAAATGT